MIMKKTSFLTTAIPVILFACSCNNINFSSEEINNNTPPQTRGIINQGYHSLGTSYDITCDYLDIDATKFPVVDIDAFLKDNPNSYVQNPTTQSQTIISAGADAEEYSQSIATNYEINSDMKLFISWNNKFKSDLLTRHEYSSKYSYARGDVTKRVKRIYLNATPEMLQNYLYPEFIRDLTIKTPDEFVQTYGTHVLLDISIGGRIQFNYRSTIFETSNAVDKKRIVEAGVKFTIGIFGADFSNSYTQQEVITSNQKNATWNTEIEFFGGENSGTTFSYNAESGITGSTFNLSSWENSVNDKNATIIQINWDMAFPIYDFIADQTKKAAIKAAIEKYLKNETITVVEVKPLYRMYSSKWRNTFFTSSLAEFNYYTQQGYTPDYGQYHYIQGYIFEKEQPGTVPLLRLYNSSKRNTFFTTSYQEADSYKQKGYYPDNAQTNYILGYVYKNSTSSNTIPIYRMYSSKASNTFITTNYNEAIYYLNNHGYVWDNGTTNRIQGYILESDL